MTEKEKISVAGDAVFFTTVFITVGIGILTRSVGIFLISVPIVGITSIVFFAILCCRKD